MKKILALITLVILPLSVQATDKNQNNTNKKNQNVYIESTLNVNERYNDNIYVKKSKKKGDWITEVRPGLELGLANSRHKLWVQGFLSQNNYAKHTGNNYFNHQEKLAGRYNFLSSGYWDLSLLNRRLSSSRSHDINNFSNNTKKPILYDNRNVSTSFYKRISNLIVNPRGKVEQYKYENGKRASGALFLQSQRDRKEYLYGGELGWVLTDKTPFFPNSNFTLYTDLEGNHLRYDRALNSDKSLKRDSNGGNYLFGFKLGSSKDLYLVAAGGFMNRKWRKKIYNNVSSWKALFRLNWKFSKEGKLSSYFTRRITEVDDANTSSSIANDFITKIEYEILKDLLGAVDLRYTKYQYQGGHAATFSNDNRKDDLYEVKTTLRYDLTSYAAIHTSYAYRKNLSNVRTSKYENNIVLVGIDLNFGSGL